MAKFKFDSKKNYTPEEIDKMTPDEQTQVMQNLLDELPDLVTGEHMILLLEGLEKNPPLAEKTLQFLPML